MAQANKKVILSQVRHTIFVVNIFFFTNQQIFCSFTRIHELSQVGNQNHSVKQNWLSNHGLFNHRESWQARSPKWLIRSHPILSQEFKQGTGLQDAITFRVGSAPSNALWFPVPVALLGMQDGSSSEDAGHIQDQQSLWDDEAQPALQLAELLQQPSEMAGRKQSTPCTPGSSSSCFPFFSLHERTRNYSDNFVQISPQVKIRAKKLQKEGFHS